MLLVFCARFTFQPTASLHAQHSDASDFVFSTAVAPPRHKTMGQASDPAFLTTYSSTLKTVDPRKFLQARTAPSVPSCLMTHLDTTSLHLPAAGKDIWRQTYSLPETRTSGLECTTPSSEVESELLLESTLIMCSLGTTDP